MSTPLNEALAALLRLAARKGVVVVDEWLYLVGSLTDGTGSWVDKRYYRYDVRHWIADDAAARIVVGCCAVFLSERGYGIASTPDVWWVINYDRCGYKTSWSLSADSPLAAYLEAAEKVLNGMPDVTTKEAK
jgi:hypothetical protein